MNKSYNGLPNLFLNKKIWLLGSALVLLFCFAPGQAKASSLTVSPPSGTFTVGSTFDVTIFLNTEKESINAVRIKLSFPPDKLQLVPDTAERSIITVYSSPPAFDNQKGIVDLQGGVPGGINVSNGQVIKLTFRVKAVGESVLRFLDESQVLANDGVGTDVLKDTQNGVYKFILPPPAGPIVVSPTHPDQAKWYAVPNAHLIWSPDSSGVDGYSYVISDMPTDIPDDISEGLRESVSYNGSQDGVRYFHIKSLNGGSWGGTTHFALNIDASPPAEFPITIVPSARTTSRQPIIQFTTTDSFSGLDHYEMKLVRLNPVVQTAQADQPIFIEIISPYVFQELELGNYDVIIRAYDKAGNFIEKSQRLRIVTPLFKFVTGQGLVLRGGLIIPWLWFWLLFGIFLIALFIAARRLKVWHDEVHFHRVSKTLPDEITKKLDELRKYQRKYGKVAVIIFSIIGFGGFANLGFAQKAELAPPYISTLSEYVTNEDIFYVGGKTDTPNSEVIIYLQNLQSGETTSVSVFSDARGDWFYSHGTFISSGNYLLWSQAHVGDVLSPPSPQVQLTVQPTAIQFGASRISKELLYLILLSIAAAAFLVILTYVIYHGHHARKKHVLLSKEIREAEESVKRGFALIRRDIEEELRMVRSKIRGKASAKPRVSEERLLKDLAEVEQYVGKEVWDIEHLEDSN